MYDLVDDKEFCRVDERIPLLMATQWGIFPNDATYDNHQYDYSRLEGLDNQPILAFIGRGYLSERERPGIFELKNVDGIFEKIRNKEVQIDLRLWYDGEELRPGGPMMTERSSSHPNLSAKT